MIVDKKSLHTFDDGQQQLHFVVSLMVIPFTGGGGSSIVKVPGDVPPTRVYFFGLLV